MHVLSRMQAGDDPTTKQQVQQQRATVEKQLRMVGERVRLAADRQRMDEAASAMQALEQAIEVGHLARLASLFRGLTCGTLGLRCMSQRPVWV